MSHQKHSETLSTGHWVTLGIVIMLAAWMFGACQRGMILRSCGNNEGEYIYSWKGSNKIACIIKKSGNNDLEIVTPNGSGRGSFMGNYVLGKAGGRNVTCAGRNVTGLDYGICTD